MLLCDTKCYGMVRTKLSKTDKAPDIDVNAEKWDFIDRNLPQHYSSEVLGIIDRNYGKSYIRRVRKYRINNTVVFNALYRVAQLHKLQLEEIASK